MFDSFSIGRHYTFREEWAFLPFTLEISEESDAPSWDLVCFIR